MGLNPRIYVSYSPFKIFLYMIERETFFLYIFKNERIDQLMIAITKNEKLEINKKFPDAHIVRTMKQKSKRHRYYCEETERVLKFIDFLRNGKRC